MNSFTVARLAGLALAALLLLGSAWAIDASTFYGGTSAWTVVGAPNQPTQFSSPALNVTYQNNLSIPVEGLVVMVLHNAMGQTVLISTATLSLQASSSGTALLLEDGLPNGDYSASVFAFTFAGVAISNSTETAFVA
ncbi:MAG: hypothetical protein ACRD6W_19005 [Nitrososphaerales archaeon]